MARAKKSLGQDARDVELNLTPMIDAVFLLLIFFLTTTVFIKITQLKIELPEATNADRIEQEKKISVLISDEGELEIGTQLVSMGELAGWLRKEKTRTGSGTLIITADSETPHGYVIDAMEIATQEGIGKIDVETMKPKSN